MTGKKTQLHAHQPQFCQRFKQQIDARLLNGWQLDI
jgi:hypothetical protein